LKFGEEFIGQSRNEELEMAVQAAEPLGYDHCLIATTKLRYMTILDGKDLFGVSKNKSIKLWNINGLFKPDDTFLTNDQAMAFRARPYFKTKFSGIEDLVYSNAENGNKMIRREQKPTLKNYTKGQLNKLGDEMKNMIFQLDSIDKMLPKTQPGSRSGSRRGISNLRGSGSRAHSLNISQNSSFSELPGLSGPRRQKNFKIGSGGTRDKSLVKKGNFI
jgi:hypothetical protein